MQVHLLHGEKSSVRGDNAYPSSWVQLYLPAGDPEIAVTWHMSFKNPSGQELPE